MKKSLAIVLVVILLVSNIVYAHGTSKKRFSDLDESHWAYNDIYRLVDLGVINGYPDGTFKATGTLTIEQFIKMVVVALELDVRDARSNERWSAPFMESAMEVGKQVDSSGNIISIGLTTNNDYFLGKEVTEPITRGEMAYVIHYVLMHQADSKELDINIEVEKLIRDLNDIPSNLYESSLVAYGNGVLTGYPDGNFYPNKALSRAEGTTVVLRLIYTNERKVIDLSDIPTTEDHYPVHNEDYAHVRRIGYNSIEFLNYVIDGNDRNATMNYKEANAPVIDGIERTELLDFIIKSNNYSVDHFNGEKEVQSYRDYGVEKGLNMNMSVINEFSDAFSTQHLMNFYFDDTNNSSYGANMVIADSYDVVVNGGASLDPTRYVVMLEVALNTNINNTDGFYTSLSNWNKYKGYNGKYAHAYDFRITDVTKVQDEIKETLYYQLEVLFEDETYKVTNMLNEFRNLERLTADNLGKSFESMGFEHGENHYYYGGMANNREYNIMIDGNTNEVGIYVSLEK